jgi:hypothetical protein
MERLLAGIENGDAKLISDCGNEFKSFPALNQGLLANSAPNPPCWMARQDPLRRWQVDLHRPLLQCAMLASSPSTRFSSKQRPPHWGISVNLRD